MFFYLAKALWFLLQPSTLIALLIGYGAILIWTGWARWGRRVVTAGAIPLVVAGVSPVGYRLDPPARKSLPTGKSRRSAAAYRLHPSRRRRGQAGRHRTPCADPERGGR